MKEYNSYKESGVEWIGKIPEHWANVRLKLISSITKGRKPNKDYEHNLDGFLPYLSMEYLRDKTDEPIFADVTEKNIVLVDEGDILILWDGSKAGEIVRAKKGVLSSTMAKIEIYDNRFESNFLNYLLQLGEKHIQANTIGMGIPHVSGNTLKDLMMLLPTTLEQATIASFLDYKTNLIDAIIEKKKRLIELLKEKRQAVINEAVTKGLNPNAHMKDSGVIWLGEIPEHWIIKKLKFTVDFKTEKGSNIERGIALEDITSWTGKGNLRDTNHFEGDLILFENGDVLFSKLRPYLAKVYMANEDGGAVGELMVLRPKQNIINQTFLFNRLISKGFIDVVDGSTYGAKMPRASVSYILDLKFGVPPIKEQIEINSYINNIIDTSNKLSTQLEIVIEKLQTYRQSLISEVVTGKIDVRDWELTTKN